MITRTKLIDDLVIASVHEGCDCVLNLAAGLDTRPYRLALPPSLLWIEADLPRVGVTVLLGKNALSGASGLMRA